MILVSVFRPLSLSAVGVVGRAFTVRGTPVTFPRWLFIRDSSAVQSAKNVLTGEPSTRSTSHKNAHSRLSMTFVQDTSLPAGTPE